MSLDRGISGFHIGAQGVNFPHPMDRIGHAHYLALGVPTARVGEGFLAEQHFDGTGPNQGSHTDANGIRIPAERWGREGIKKTFTQRMAAGVLSVDEVQPDRVEQRAMWIDLARFVVELERL